MSSRRFIRSDAPGPARNRFPEYPGGEPAGFEAGQVVPVTSFKYPQESEGPQEAIREDEEKAIRLETISNTIRFLSQNATGRQVGRRVMLIAYLLGQGGCKTQRDLAHRLGVSEGRVSKAVKSARQFLSGKTE